MPNNHTIYSDRLYHFGIKGMKWGVRRFQNPDGTSTPRGKKRLRAAKAMAEELSEKTNKTLATSDRRDKRDDAVINFNTKGMSDKQKKIYSLNYYNDIKEASRISLNNSKAQKQKLNSDNRSRSERVVDNILGSDMLNRLYDRDIEYATENYAHYSNKVDKLLKDMGDIKLTTIQSHRQYSNGITGYSWLGEEYVEQK